MKRSEPKAKKARAQSLPAAEAYSLWTVPHGEWKPLLSGLPAKLRLTDARRAVAEEKVKERVRAFETPISADALNRNV